MADDARTEIDAILRLIDVRLNRFLQQIRDTADELRDDCNDYGYQDSDLLQRANDILERIPRDAR